MNEFERKVLHKVNNDQLGDSRTFYRTERFYFKKIGSALGYGPTTNFTELVYANTYIPFDSSF